MAPKRKKKTTEKLFLKTADLWLCGEVNDEMLSKFFEFFVQIDDPDIHITCHLSSGGGDVDVGFAIHDALRSIPNHVDMIGYGNVGSIAVIIFCAGNRRILTKNASLLIHPVSAEMSGDAFAMKMAVGAVMESQRRIVQTISDRSNDPKAILKASTTETFLTAEEGLKLGIATDILEFCD